MRDNQLAPSCGSGASPLTKPHTVNAQLAHYRNKLAYEMDSADLFDALERRDDVVVVDARQPHGFAAEHIPSAINLPHREMTEASTAQLDRGRTYVTYCDGIGCNASTKGALRLAELGFEVRELLGGIDWWKRDGYATDGTEGTGATGVRCAC